MSSRKVPTAKHFKSSDRQERFAKGKWKSPLGRGVFEAVLTEMREEVCPAYGKTYGFHREPSPREERGTDHRELRGESKASDLHRGSNRRLPLVPVIPVTWEVESGDPLSIGIRGQHGKGTETLI